MYIIIIIVRGFRTQNWLGERGCIGKLHFDCIWSIRPEHTPRITTITIYIWANSKTAFGPNHCARDVVHNVSDK